MDFDSTTDAIWNELKSETTDIDCSLTRINHGDYVNFRFGVWSESVLLGIRVYDNNDDLVTVHIHDKLDNDALFLSRVFTNVEDASMWLSGMLRGQIL